MPAAYHRISGTIEALASRCFMNRLSWSLVIAAVVAAPGRDARACDPIGDVVHTVVPSMQATDQTPPTLPVIPAPTIHYADNSGQGNGCGGAKCEDVNSIGIPAVATDDMTPSEHIGYRLSLEAGRLPPNMVLPTDAIEPMGNFVRLYFGTDAVSVDFTLQVVAIDLAGNESAPQSVHVKDVAPSACSAGGRPVSGWGAVGLAGAALLLAARRRRRA